VLSSSSFVSLFLSSSIVKFDTDTEQPIRVNGRCVPCKPGEVGEMLGKIVDGDPLREFPGYTRKEATEKKASRQGIAHQR
jgi:hypothetical protein